MSTTSKMIAQLRLLLRLTQTEIQIAETRQAQARTEAVRRELAENARNAVRRSARIDARLRDLGGIPDVLAPVVGRAAALVKAVVEQGEPLEEALLEDLALEHQLLDRSRYLKVLATAAENGAVRRLAEDLETAHSATVEWLTVVLAEEALGGPAALRATPLQAATGAVRNAVLAPVRWSAGRANRVVDALGATVGRAEDLADDVAGRASTVAEATREAVAAGRGAGLRAAERSAREDGADDLADAAHEARRSSGTLTEAELPIPSYDTLNVNAAVAAIKNLHDPAQLQAVIRYEENHRNRQGVVSATQVQLAAVAKETLEI